MVTHARQEFDEAMAEWLAGIKAEQAGEVLDAYADLYLANEDAKAIKDPNSPAAGEAHQRMNAALDGIVGA